MLDPGSIRGRQQPTCWANCVVTGGCGNVGAVVTQLIFFKGSRYSKETGITLSGHYFSYISHHGVGCFAVRCRERPPPEKTITTCRNGAPTRRTKCCMKQAWHLLITVEKEEEEEEEEVCTLELCLPMLLRRKMFSHLFSFPTVF
ncbi:hypothetical protein V6N13_035600 [Hibiscus sabdariffa]